MEVYDTGNGRELYVGGSFSSAGSIPAQGVARWGCAVGPSLSATQPAGSGGPLYVTATHLLATREYFTFFSVET